MKIFTGEIVIVFSVSLLFFLTFFFPCSSFASICPFLLYPPWEWPHDTVLQSVKQQLSLDQQLSLCGAERR